MDIDGIKIADFLIKRAGVKVNARDNEDRTPLFSASSFYEPSTEAAKPLIDTGADVNAKNKDGESAYDWAIKGGRFEISELLKQVMIMQKPPPTKQAP